jgi:hypothetical protein
VDTTVCRPVVPEPRTAAFEDERHARLRALNRSVGTADGEERRALLEQRRAAVVRQLRRLAIELTDIDRQLDEIEQSER